MSERTESWSYNKAIRWLARIMDIPETELHTLGAEQAENLIHAIRDNDLSEEERVQIVMDNGYFDLPTNQESAKRHLHEMACNEIRATVDFHNAQCLARGKPEEMLHCKKEENGYPPARAN